MTTARPMFVLRAIWHSVREDITGVEAQAMEYEAMMGREAFDRQWSGTAKARARLRKLLGAR